MVNCRPPSPISAYDRPLFRRQLRADRRRQSVAERAVAGRRAEPGARPGRLVRQVAAIDGLGGNRGR